jgi:hypothetical protein
MMNQGLLLGTALGVLALAGMMSAPKILAWPYRVRWTVLAQAAGYPAPGLTIWPRFDIREVRLASVEVHDAGVEVDVVEVGRPPRDATRFCATTRPGPPLVSMLEDWCALRTPMLLYVDPAGVGSLSGPAATVSNLRRVTRVEHGSRPQDKDGEW